MGTPPDHQPAALASGVPFPSLVRKVDRKGHWRRVLDDGSDGRPAAARAVFPRDMDGTVSVWLVRDDADLDRVAIGLNSMRTGSSLTEEIRLLWFTEPEALEAGLAVEVTEGATKCRHANRLHRGLVHDEGAVRRLVEALFAVSRDLVKVTKSRLRSAAESAKQEGCHAATDSDLCRCESIGVDATSH